MGLGAGILRSGRLGSVCRGREGSLPGGGDVEKELLDVGKAGRVKGMFPADGIAYANAQSMSLY